METKIGNVKHSLLVSGIALAMAMAMSTGANAAGTASGTVISNTATVDYKVGGVSQTPINSVAATFKVDTKVNLTVSTDDVAAISVTPNTLDNVMTFTVTNTGNEAFMDMSLTATALAGGAAVFGGTDNIDADVVQVFVESGATPGYQAAQDTATYIDELATDTSKKVYIVSDFNAGYANGDIASYHLVAEARQGNGGATGALGAVFTATAGADTAGTVDVVFADGAGSGDAANDAKFSSQDDYKITTATLGITKSSSVVSDPINGTTNPKRIPGAVVEYLITVSNGAGASTATTISVTDNLNTEILSNGTLAFNTQYDLTAGKGIVVAYPGNGNVDTEFTNAADGAEDGTVSADWNAGTNVLTVSGFSLNASQSATVKFRVTIQ